MKTRTADQIDFLLQLTLAPEGECDTNYLEGLEDSEYRALVALAEAHHVTARALNPLVRTATAFGKTDILPAIRPAIEGERERIAQVLPVLNRVSEVFASHGHPLVVIKSLDHWPDFGDDADFYTGANVGLVNKIFGGTFHARRKHRTLGDCLAAKKTFILPGVQTHFEAHMRRLGQVGEQVQVARRFLLRAQPVAVDGYTFLVPAPEERILIAALMRMYRHLHIRICDVVNTGKLVQEGIVDFDELRTAAEVGGIWDGVATYLSLVSEFYAKFQGAPLALPGEIRRSAVFSLDKLFVRGNFMRIPMVPEAALLFRRQCAATIRRGSVPATLRLMTVPPLVSASSVANTLFGRGLRIW
jgi:hypothetical protein